MNLSEKHKQILREFMRYTIVGGLSFLVDLGMIVLFRELVFRSTSEAVLAVCTAIGFVCGLAANYLLSMVFVFTTETQQKKTRTVKAAVIYAAVGIIGFLLTEIGMYIGVLIAGSEGFWYVLVRCIVAGVVLVWNYAGRKIFVYKGD